MLFRSVWSGDYFAVEAMNRLGLPDGAVRVGIVHYNTADEVDRLLEALVDSRFAVPTGRVPRSLADDSSREEV